MGASVQVSVTSKNLFFFDCTCVCVYVCDTESVFTNTHSPGGVGWLHFMGVPAIGPEDEQPIKQRLDAGHHIFAFGIDLQHPSLCLCTYRRS